LVLLHRGGVVASGRVDEVLVPAVLEPVYGIHIETVRAEDGQLQLLFRTPTHSLPSSLAHSHTPKAGGGVTSPA
ncbi:MAG TPA: histidinol phosphatase, partial [Microbacterium sp.]|nr:histidinol phosphatase [Microbacterium sp.]